MFSRSMHLTPAGVTFMYRKYTTTVPLKFSFCSNCIVLINPERDSYYNSYSKEEQYGYEDYISTYNINKKEDNKKEDEKEDEKEDNKEDRKKHRDGYFIYLRPGISFYVDKYISGCDNEGGVVQHIITIKFINQPTINDIIRYTSKNHLNKFMLHVKENKETKIYTNFFSCNPNLTIFLVVTLI